MTLCVGAELYYCMGWCKNRTCCAGGTLKARLVRSIINLFFERTKTNGVMMSYVFAEAFVLMGVLQLALGGMKWLLLPLLPDTRLVYKLFTMVCMMCLTLVVVAYARYGRRGRFGFLPQPWSRRYTFFTGLFLLLLLLSPANFTQGLPAVGVALYGSVVIPLYEELIFRGYLWNRLSDVGYSPRRLILCTALLFAVWHVGYMANAIAEGNWFAVISKVMVGLCYGFLLGWVRVKTGNCYSTCLVHGLMNLLSV